MADTLLSELRLPIRVTVGDIAAEAYEFSDDHLDAALKLVLRGGRIPGHALNAAQNGASPELNDPNAYLLTVYEAAVILVRPRTEAHRYRTRALSESFEGQKILFWHLLQETGRLEELREGSLFRSWQDFHQFVTGNYGTNVWERLVDLKLHRPMWTVDVSAAGVQPA